MRAFVLLVLVACAHGVADPQPPPPDPPSTAPRVPSESTTIIEPDPCSLRERIVIDGGFVFDVPLPCVPLPSRDFGDPQP